MPMLHLLFRNSVGKYVLCAMLCPHLTLPSRVKGLMGGR